MRHGAMRGAGWDVRESARDRDALGGSFLIDARGTIVGFDGAMERLTGWTAADVVGRGGTSPVLVDATTLVGARPETVDLTLRCRDGSLVEIEAALQADASSTETATVTVLRVIARGEEGTALLPISPTASAPASIASCASSSEARQQILIRVRLRAEPRPSRTTPLPSRVRLPAGLRRAGRYSHDSCSC